MKLLLEAFGFDILPKPLGPVPYVEGNPTAYRNEPLFVDSWPILVLENDSDGTHVFYSIEMSGDVYPLVVFKEYFDGGILLVGDSQFLLDKNLESSNDYWPGNIEFLRNILDEAREMGVPK